MSRIGWMLPIPWTRTFSPVTAVSEVGNELVATCTLWAASHEEYAKWHILAMWITTRAAHAFTKLDVHNVVIDKTFTEQFEPIECRGKFEQYSSKICKVTSTTGRKCAPRVRNCTASPPMGSADWTQKSGNSPDFYGS